MNPDEYPDNEDPYFYKRAQIINVVAVITEFMMSIPELEGKGWVHPLFTLEAHLRDVHKGLKSQLFSPPRERGKPKPSTVDQRTRAHAAAAMQLFFEANGRRNLEEAARRVARRLIHIGNSHLFTGKSEPYKQVETWREMVMGHAPGEATEFYRYLVANDKAAGLSPEQAAKRLLNLLS